MIQAWDRVIWEPIPKVDSPGHDTRGYHDAEVHHY